MTDKQRLEEALKFVRICWENIRYQHEIILDIDTEFTLLARIAKRENWK